MLICYIYTVTCTPNNLNNYHLCFSFKIHKVFYFIINDTKIILVLSTHFFFFTNKIQISSFFFDFLYSMFFLNNQRNPFLCSCVQCDIFFIFKEIEMKYMCKHFPLIYMYIYTYPPFYSSLYRYSYNKSYQSYCKANNIPVAASTISQ